VGRWRPTPGAAPDRMKFAQKIAGRAGAGAAGDAGDSWKDAAAYRSAASRPWRTATGRLRGGIELALKPSWATGSPAARRRRAATRGLHGAAGVVAIRLPRPTTHWTGRRAADAVYIDEDGLANYFRRPTRGRARQPSRPTLMAISEAATKAWATCFALPRRGHKESPCRGE